MRLKNIGHNMSEVEINGSFVLFSYETPVAGRSIKAPSGDEYEEEGFFKTATYYSATTSKHINKYFKKEWNIDSKDVAEVSQDFIDGLMGE
jgi:hypothetical protein